MSRLSQQGRRKWRSRVAKERAKARARRIFIKRVRASRDAMMAFYREHIGNSICLISDGAMLDDKNRAALIEMAKEAKAQVWLEIVGEKGATVIMEDGAVKAK